MHAAPTTRGKWQANPGTDGGAGFAAGSRPRPTRQYKHQATRGRAMPQRFAGGMPPLRMDRTRSRPKNGTMGQTSTAGSRPRPTGQNTHPTNPVASAFYGAVSPIFERPQAAVHIHFSFLFFHFSFPQVFIFSPLYAKQTPAVLPQRGSVLIQALYALRGITPRSRTAGTSSRRGCARCPAGTGSAARSRCSTQRGCSPCPPSGCPRPCAAAHSG